MGKSDSPAEVAGKEPKLDLTGVVEPALAKALALAAEHGRWDIVEQLAGELAKRRRGRDGEADGDWRGERTG